MVRLISGGIFEIEFAFNGCGEVAFWGWDARWTDRSDGVRHQVTTGVSKTNGCGGKHLDRIG